VWSRRADKKCAVLPVTVYATVDQFNAVSYRVIATVLKYPYGTTEERALVVEKWIEVAQVCLPFNDLLITTNAMRRRQQAERFFLISAMTKCVTSTRGCVILNASNEL
jgi:hypothetical protein